jgi:prepilin signal peptidase PulO-like enzyme (type II secretory pathway)
VKSPLLFLARAFLIEAECMLEEIIREEIVRYLLFAIAILVGWLGGNGAVFLFNKLPGRWLTDYGKEPLEEILHPTRQRIESTPWKLVFSMFFIASGIWMAESLWQSRLSPWAMGALLMAYMICFWLLLLIGLADGKYGIIPDQLVILLALTAMAFAPYKETFLDPLYGVLLGGGGFFLISLLFQKISGKPSLGMGDVKLLGAVGLLMGFRDTASVMMVTAILAGVGFSAGLVKGTLKLKDTAPLGPYIVAATYLCIVFDITKWLFFGLW